MKCCDLACNVKQLPLKTCKNFTIKVEVKYLLPTSSSDTNVYILKVQR